ncbi:hypothetical protein ACFPIJ_58675 [Dactylosporangium cerinum]|uniref:Uncharacterized protein n=1 Tax=Dactylosporangium cerinum TaxID=1434730 RepID=A0ABV9WJR8_9ACTN
MEIVEHILAAPKPDTDTPINGLIVSLIWVLAVGLGIYEYGRSKGRIGRALGVSLGGGLLATFVAYPAVLYQDVPSVFKALIDWAVAQVT